MLNGILLPFFGPTLTVNTSSWRSMIMPCVTAALERYRRLKQGTGRMLVERTLVAIVIIPVVIFLIVAGGWVYALGVAIVLAVAAWEFWRMVTNGGFQPSAILLIGGVALMALLRYQFEFTGSQFGASMLILLTMARCNRSYELSRNQPASDFAITLAGIFYLGWLGSYFISLRNLPNGEWWALTALPAAWIADGGAYFVGRQFGKHKLSPVSYTHLTLPTNREV